MLNLQTPLFDACVKVKKGVDVGGWTGRLVCQARDTCPATPKKGRDGMRLWYRGLMIQRILMTS